MEKHNIKPIFDNNSIILILGSFPSVKSREQAFYYAHPQNRFWKVLPMILGIDTPTTVKDKTKMFINHKIAIWDVIESCDIVGSMDNNITNVIPNKLERIFSTCKIKAVFINGGTAYKLYKQYFSKKYDVPYFKLPSTSAANASYSVDRLYKSWVVIKEYLDD